MKPAIQIKTCVLECCAALPIDTGDHLMKQQLKDSKIGHEVRSLTHSLTRSLAHSLAHSLTHSLARFR